MKKRAHRDETYWGRPVPGFGDARAPLFILGLAPAAHGGNRTGRVFTGDSSGDWLYRALFAAGFASQPTSLRRGDGLELRGAYVSATCRCAPPDNLPTRLERARCAEYLDRELALLRPRVAVCLGGIAWEAMLAALVRAGLPRPRPRPRFGHGVEVVLAAEVPVLIGSYHPSRQNTQTGRLQAAQFEQVFRRARVLSS